MILAAYSDNAYDLVLLLHIVAVLIAFAPAVNHPIFAQRFKADGQLERFATHAAANGRFLHLPALVVAGLLGIVLVVLSDEIIEFSEAWVSLSLLVWIALAGVVSALILPSERKVAAGQLEAQRTAEMGGQLAGVLLLVMLYLMIFKPGSELL